jgi:hypothetical protein
MKPALYINRLKDNIEIFNSILKNISEQQKYWKPVSSKWSILEVVHHLYDEEKEDFRKRLKLTLKNPEIEWPAIDPQAWVVERNYNQQNFVKTKKLFIKERKKSIVWLKNLKNPKWENIYHHPKIGKIAAGDLLVSWVTHDFLHIRQLTLLNLDYYKMLAKPYNSRYALP